ncbi:MAG: NAD-dependent dehydratase [Sphingobacteriales bacterium]|nr:MAG: NAD-dependent dehydratase [Sphingobacteriales bacterium]
MKYVITGGAGHISKPLAQQLINAGHEVTIIGRNEKNLEPLTSIGAKAAIGSVEDVQFLTETFKGADAVYTMVPPNFAVTGDWLDFIAGVGQNYKQAIVAAGVKHVVNLSSIGAHLPEGVGPVSGLHRVEQALDELDGVNVLHLRPAYFFYNLFANIDMIKHMGIVGGNFGLPGQKIPMVHTQDIARIAAEAMLKLDFTGKSHRYIVSDEPTSDDIATVLGSASGKEGLKWIVFEDEQSLQGMLKAGLPAVIAEKYVEMGRSMREGRMAEHYFATSNGQTGTVKLSDFAKEFEAAYQH